MRFGFGKTVGADAKAPFSGEKGARDRSVRDRVIALHPFRAAPAFSAAIAAA